MPTTSELQDIALRQAEQAATFQAADTTAPETSLDPVGRYRWVICALLFLATTSNYMDRQVLGILKPQLQTILHMNEVQYGNIVMAFQAAYAVGLLLFGWIIDRIGTKRGYTLSIALWSLAACGHALTTSVFGFGIARLGLGISEAGNFPAAIKTVAEWFPRRERALATGIFNSGSNVGAVVAPAVVPWLTLTYGWQAAFIVVGAVGFVWIGLWLALYARPEQSPRVAPRELAYIRSDRDEEGSETAPRMAWSSLLSYRQTWGFVCAKFLTDPIWWFYLYWLPDFLNKHYGLDLKHLGLPLIAIYMMSSVGSIGGGWLSGTLIRSGWAVDQARKTVLLICALCVVPIMGAGQAHNVWVAVLLIGLAAAAHQGWSATLFTTVSDLFPRRAVGSITGIGGMAGSVGGMLFSTGAGRLLQVSPNNYHVLFLIAGSAYLVGLALFRLLIPRIEPVRI